MSGFTFSSRGWNRDSIMESQAYPTVLKIHCSSLLSWSPTFPLHLTSAPWDPFGLCPFISSTSIDPVFSPSCPLIGFGSSSIGESLGRSEVVRGMKLPVKEAREREIARMWPIPRKAVRWRSQTTISSELCVDP